MPRLRFSPTPRKRNGRSDAPRVRRLVPLSGAPERPFERGRKLMGSRCRGNANSGEYGRAGRRHPIGWVCGGAAVVPFRRTD